MIFIDTGALVARHVAADQHHAAALSAWERIETSRDRCFTSNFVLDEVWTLLSRRAGATFAAERARRLYASPRFTILRPEQDDEMDALSLLVKYTDQSASYTDCISFVLMRRSKIRRVFTYDAHFERAGFERFA
jgi:predicted nucleic acid-binding protein